MFTRQLICTYKGYKSERRTFEAGTIIRKYVSDNFGIRYTDFQRHVLPEDLISLGVNMIPLSETNKLFIINKNIPDYDCTSISTDDISSCY